MNAALLSTLSNSRITYAVVLLGGLALCTGGIGRAAQLGLWLHPITIAGYALGLLALLLGLQGIFHLHLLPVGNSLALGLMLGIIVVKFGLALLYRS